MLHKLLMATALAGGLAASPASARLQLSISDGGTTFSCFDGQLSCDQSGGVNNLLLVNTTVGGAFVQIALAQSLFGAVNELQLSASNIINQSLAPITVTLLASDTDFKGPVKFINNSASLTFNANVGAPDSTLKFWADAANAQGANPNQTPGTLLESVSGHALTDPDSFAGSLIAPFATDGFYSMTEGAQLVLRAGGSITGFNQSMESSAVPEPSTWVMMGLGLAALGYVGSRKKGDRLNSIAA